MVVRREPLFGSASRHATLMVLWHTDFDHPTISMVEVGPSQWLRVGKVGNRYRKPYSTTLRSPSTPLILIVIESGQPDHPCATTLFGARGGEIPCRATLLMTT
jgi:hypothetical protein